MSRKLHLICAIVLILMLVNVQAQILQKTTSKNILELSGMANVPLLSGAFKQDNFFNKNGEIVGRTDWIDYGINLRYTHQFSKKFRLGIDFILKRFEVFTDRLYTSNFKNNILESFSLTTNYKVQSVSLNHYTIQPVIVFSSPSSINGSGIEHTFGIGLTFYSPKRKSYAYSLTNYPTNESSWSAADNYFLDHNWDYTFGTTLQYGISLSVPLNNSFLFKIGTATFLNIYFKPDFAQQETLEEGLFNLENIYYNAQRENFITWNLQTGIVYRF